MDDTTKIILAHFWAVDEKGNNGTVPVLWGPPASAKTALYSTAYETLGLPMVRLSVLATGEGMFGVVPRHNDRGRLEFPPPVIIDAFSYELGRDGTPDYNKPLWSDGVPRGVLFLDEFNGRPDLQAALMDMTAERVWGSTYLGEGVRACMAANPTEISAGGYEPPEPLVSRVGHYDVEPPDHDTWSEWLTTKYKGAKSLPKRRAPVRANDEKLAQYLATEARREKELPAYMAEAAAQIAAFTAIRATPGPDSYFVAPRKGNGAECRQRYAAPNLRAWVYAAATLASARWQRFGVDIQQEVVASFVGDGVATAFLTWVDQMDLPNPAALLQGHEAFTHEANRPDRTDAVVSGLVTAMQNCPPGEVGKQRVTRGWQILNAIRKAAGDDIVAQAVRPLVQAGLYGPRYGAESSEFLKAVGDLAAEMK